MSSLPNVSRNIVRELRERPAVRQRPFRTFRPALPRLRSIAPWAALVLIVLCWEIITRLQLYPAFIVPPPAAVWEKFLQVLGDGRLWLHTSTTLGEIALGLLAGVPIGVALGYLLAKNEMLEAALSPIILAAQSTPVVAYAPILVIWFGTGITSKVFICALIVFFPILMNTMAGLRSTPTEERELMRSLSAGRLQTFTKLEVPAALPVLLGGLKISATLAVIGAVVGEFISASAGLGFWIKLARDQYDTALVIVAVLTLAAMARLMYGGIALLERRLLHWRP